MASEVGNAQVSIFPVMTGFKSAVLRESQAAGKQGASGIKKAFSGAGKSTGASLGKDLKSAFSSSSSGLATSSLSKLKSDVSSASKVLSNARLKQQDAAGKVRVAEVKLQEAISKSGQGSSQAVAAEEKLASARRQEEIATDAVKTASDRLKTAQESLKSTQDQVANSPAPSKLRAAWESSFNAIKSGASKLGSGIKQALQVGVTVVAAGITSAIAAAKTGISTFSSLQSGVNSLQRITGGTTAEVSELRGAMQLSGMDVDKAGSSLTIFSKKLAAVQGDSKATADMQSLLGTSVTNADGSIRSMSAMLPEVADRFKSMPNGAEKTALAVQLFGKSGTAMLPFLNKGSEGIADLEAKAESLGLTLDDQSASTFSEYKSASRTLSAVFQGLSSQIGQAAMPIVTAFSTFIMDVASPAIGELSGFVEDLGAKISNGLGGFSEFTAGLTMSSDAASKLESPLKGLAGVGQSVQGFFKKFAPALVPAAGALTALGSSAIPGILSKIPVLGGSLSGLAGPLKLLGGPIGVALSAFAGLVAVSPELQSALSGLVSAVLGSLTGAFEAIGPAVDSILPTLTLVAQVIAGTLAQAITELTPVITQIIDVVAELVASLLPQIAPVLGSVGAAIAVILQGLIPIVTTILEGLMPTIQALLPVVDTVFNTIATVIQSVMGIIQGIIQVVTSAIAGDWSSAWEGIKQVASSAWEGIKALVSGALSAVKGTISAALGLIKSIWSAGWSWIKDLASSIWSGITGIWSKGVSTVSGIFQRMGDAISNPFRSAFNAIKNLWNNTIGRLTFTVPDWVPGMGGKGWSAPKLATGGVVQQATLAWVGEGNEPEAVLPLTKLDAMLRKVKSSGSGQSLAPRIYVQNPFTGEYLLAQMDERATNVAIDVANAR